jgi:hypothetical protein
MSIKKLSGSLAYAPRLTVIPQLSDNALNLWDSQRFWPNVREGI